MYHMRILLHCLNMGRKTEEIVRKSLGPNPFFRDSTSIKGNQNQSCFWALNIHGGGWMESVTLEDEFLAS